MSINKTARASGSPAATQRPQNPDTMSLSDVPARVAWISHADNSAKKASFTQLLYSQNVRSCAGFSDADGCAKQTLGGSASEKPAQGTKSREVSTERYGKERCNGPLWGSGGVRELCVAQRGAGEREMRGRALGGSRAVNGRRLPLPVDDQGVSKVIFGTAAAVTEIHEVSTLMVSGVGAGRELGCPSAAKISITIMRPPQCGHGHGKTCG